MLFNIFIDAILTIISDPWISESKYVSETESKRMNKSTH